MMKKLQVMIEDNQMKKLKLYALENDLTLKDIVASMLETFFKETPKPEEPKPKQPVTAPKREKLDYNPDEVFVIRKTHKEKEETVMKYYQMYGVDWSVFEGMKSHFDKDGSIIPFRLTDYNGKVCEPDDEQIEELERATGKKVVFE